MNMLIQTFQEKNMNKMKKHEFKVGDLVRLKDGKRTFLGKDRIGFIADISEDAVYITTPNGGPSRVILAALSILGLGCWEKTGETK